MRKTCIFFFLALSLISCGKSGGDGGSNNSQSDTSLSDISTTSPAPVEAQMWTTNLSFIKLSKDQEVKIQTAAELVQKVVSSDEFKNKILNFKYNGKNTFANNGGLTNAQIYKKILDASEKLNPGADHQMDLTIEAYYTSANVIGYTLPTVNQIWVNTRYLNNFTPVDVSDNITHEWLHKIGFGHDYNRTAQRPYSVPYAVGYIVKALAAKYYN